MKDHRSVGIAAESLYNSYEFYFGQRKANKSPSVANQEIKPMLRSTPFRAFHNALRILRSLDYHEVSFLNDDDHSWAAFYKDPYEFFITTSDSNASLIWAAIQRRQPEELKQNV
jgi:hypothetical protein